MEQKLEQIGREIQESLKRILREYAEALVLALILALMLRHFVLASYKVTSESMAPHLVPGDFIVGFKPPYGFRVPFSDKRFGPTHARRGDIAILKCNTQREGPLCIKRVLGVPGDRLEVVDGHLIRNGETLSFAIFPADLTLLQVVPPDMYFVSSDRFGHSAAHFEWGLVSRDRMEARALLIWFSKDSSDQSAKWNRVGRMIH